MSTSMISRNLVNLRSFLRPTRVHRCVGCRLITTSTRSSATVSSTKESKDVSEIPLSTVSTDAKINSLVGEISSLTLLQAAELVAALKSHLNIQEVAVPVVGAAPAAPPEPEKTEVEEKPKEKTAFTVKLESFEPTSKPKVIREIKAIMPNMTLMEAKTFVEGAPKTIKENLSKEDAEKLKATFEALGAKIVLE